MTTDKVTIDRELLERLACEVVPTTHQELLNASDDFGAAIKELRAILTAPRQPEGEIKPDITTKHGYPAYSVKQHQRAIAELREECKNLRDRKNNVVSECLELCDERDTLRQQLAERDAALDHIAKVCRNSRTSTRRLRWIEQRAKWAIDGKPYDDTAFDLPKDSTASAEKYKAQRDKLAGLLREARCFVQQIPSLELRIDAALAEVNK